MSSLSWLRSWFARSTPNCGKGRAPYRPKLEALEDRLVPATFVVTNLTDPFRTQGSLRGAIQDANANPGPDTIVFAAPLTVPPQVRTITLRAALPDITDTITINGTITVGGVPKPGIEIDGSQISVSANGLNFFAGSGSSIVKGLIINRMPGHGIVLAGGSNGSTIQGCFIGTTKDGTAAAGNNLSGIAILNSPNHIIGGPGPQDRNVIAANVTSQIFIQGSAFTNNLIQNNILGLAKDGLTDISETNIGLGINNNGGNLVVGNIISGQHNTGIFLFGSGCTGNVIRGNKIGVAEDGVTPAGNDRSGVLITSLAHDNVIGGPSATDGNLIAFDGLCGILIGQDPFFAFADAAGRGNQLQNNLVFGSVGLIDLGNFDGQTANDPLDADTGPNNFQNFPTLLSAARNATATSVAGTLSSQPGRSYRIEITNFDFVSNQNQNILGSFTVTTDASGNATFNQFFGVSLVSSQVIAIATDLTTGDTSEFGNAVAVDTAPMIKNDVLTPDINEGDKATLSGQLVDPDKGDKLSLLVNWGDGSPIQTYHPKLDPFAFQHLYEDDGTYDVQFTWLDDHGASNTRTRQVVVHNVRPELQQVALHPDEARVHQQVVLAGKIVESGADPLTLSVDWGDGTVETVSGEDLRNFRAKHRYQSTGHFTVLVTVDDGDGGIDSKTLFIDVG